MPMAAIGPVTGDRKPTLMTVGSAGAAVSLLSASLEVLSCAAELVSWVFVSWPVGLGSLVDSLAPLGAQAMTISAHARPEAIAIQDRLNLVFDFIRFLLTGVTTFGTG
jgi:hypothetical protein